jgi:hypothetical protein
MRMDDTRAEEMPTSIPVSRYISTMISNFQRLRPSHDHVSSKQFFTAGLIRLLHVTVYSSGGVLTQGMSVVLNQLDGSVSWYPIRFVEDLDDREKDLVLSAPDSPRLNTVTVPEKNPQPPHPGPPH